MTRKLGWTGVVLLAAAVCAAVYTAALARHGLSARDEPSRAEAMAARAMRRLAVPAALRDTRNPVTVSPAVLAEGRAHFANHCAVCHGNDGKGDTAMGPNFYPKVPDMTRAETQSQTDGQIFATIENGVRLTGMPAWGDGSQASARSTWVLVHFIRSLPRLTMAEVEEMKAQNPKTREEWEMDAEAARFLDGNTTGGR
jgi:mono/diheme cytochrome c family protein